MIRTTSEKFAVIRGAAGPNSKDEYTYQIVHIPTRTLIDLSHSTADKAFERIKEIVRFQNELDRLADLEREIAASAEVGNDE